MFNITINVGGVIVHDRRVIARNYLNNGFWLDFFAALPYALAVKGITGGSSGNLVAVRLLRLLRLVRVVIKLMRNSSNVTEAVTSGRFRFNPALARVVQLLCMLLLTCHWMGCMWWCAAHGISSDNSNSSSSSNNDDNDDDDDDSNTWNVDNASTPPRCAPGWWARSTAPATGTRATASTSGGLRSGSRRRAWGCATPTASIGAPA